jgi:Cys-tRNA(Pro)/Cys-tRNA(Cys) deacylase
MQTLTLLRRIGAAECLLRADCQHGHQFGVRVRRWRPSVEQLRCDWLDERTIWLRVPRFSACADARLSRPMARARTELAATTCRNMKTNAVRILESLRIHFELRTYEVDPEDLSAETVARKVGMPIRQVYKTLVCRGERGGTVFAVVAGDCEIDLKVLARSAGDRKLQLAPLREVQPLTGYVRGGVTVLGAKKAYPAFVDEEFITHDQVSVSAGTRGLQILISPHDYLQATHAALVAKLGRRNDSSTT